MLDVGSGDRPFPPATTLVDRLPREHVSAHKVSSENPTSAIVHNGVPFVVGDIEALPFGEQAFDFVHASHVIEHVTDPLQAAKELARVAPRGYLECPRAWHEFVDASPFHRWLIDFVHGELQFRPKTEVEAQFMASRRLFDADPALFGRLYGQVFSSVDPGGSSVEKSICHVCVYWEHTIPCRILPPAAYFGS